MSQKISTSQGYQNFKFSMTKEQLQEFEKNLALIDNLSTYIQSVLELVNF